MEKFWVYLLVLTLTSHFSTCSGAPTTTRFTDGFNNFITDNAYKGGQVAVLLGNRLAVAHAYGHTLTGHGVHSETVQPISSVSKSITAAAVIKLMEAGKIHPTSKVFGHEGILHSITPWKRHKTDPRLYHITVDDLLRHAGGWDYDHSPVKDPIFNKILLERNHTTKDIGKEMNIKRDLDTVDIIRYMMSQQLDFTPGSRSKDSNLGYAILGQIVDTVSGTSYEAFVEHHVLTPCGMWRTRMGPHPHQKEPTSKDGFKEEFVSHVYAYKHPELVAAAHGWFSNSYDLMRFMQCLDGSANFTLLNQTSLEYLIKKPRAGSLHVETWIGAGFHVHNHGAIWVEGDTYSAEIILFHKNLFHHHKHHQHHHRGHTDDDPTSWVYILEGKPKHHPRQKQSSKPHAQLKHESKNMIEKENSWPQHDAYMDDLADNIATVNSITRVSKYKVDEHRANAYLRALKLRQYNIIWLNAYEHSRRTHMSVIAQKDEIGSQFCIALTGLSENKLVHTKLHLAKFGYDMTFFQNYQSRSHSDAVFLVIFHKGAFTNTTHMRYGIRHFDRPYKTFLNLHVEDGYHALVQSIDYKRNDALISFILEEDSNKGKYRSVDKINVTGLRQEVLNNALQEMKLYYLDSSQKGGKPRFSALFKKTETISTFEIVIDQTEDSMDKIIKQKERDEKLLPSIIVGYTNKQKQLLYVLYMTKQ